jgi:hypothetical protein
MHADPLLSSVAKMFGHSVQWHGGLHALSVYTGYHSTASSSHTGLAFKSSSAATGGSMQNSSPSQNQFGPAIVLTNPAFVNEKTPEGTSVEDPDSTVQHQSSRVADTFSIMAAQPTVVENPHKARNHPPVHPRSGASKAELLDYIQQQLDCFGKEPLLIERFQLLGPSHRATGGTPWPSQRLFVIS